jgi:SprT-like protein
MQNARTVLLIKLEDYIVDDIKLQLIVEETSINYFQKKFNHQAIFNTRLRTTGGRYLLKSHNIEINPKYYLEHGINEMIGIIKHELCHYHLHIEGKGYKHGDRDFKELLIRVGAPRFCTPLIKSSVTKNPKLIYKCKSCNQLYNRKRRVDTTRLVCGKCGGEIYLYKKG